MSIVSKLISSIFKNNSASHRDRGDRLRDQRDLIGAEHEYSCYLQGKPHDFDIWVQRGHCLKDLGRFVEAEVCYEQAFQLKPDDSDLHLNIGHLWKLKGNSNIAQIHYRKALDLDPSSVFARQELLAISASNLNSGSNLQVGVQHQISTSEVIVLADFPCFKGKNLAHQLVVIKNRLSRQEIYQSIEVSGRRDANSR